MGRVSLLGAGSRCSQFSQLPKLATTATKHQASLLHLLQNAFLLKLRASLTKAGSSSHSFEGKNNPYNFKMFWKVIQKPF